MIAARFISRGGSLCGFVISGHDGSRPAGESILCAAVSSAALLTANTLTEIFGCAAETDEADGYLSVQVTDRQETASRLIAGLRLHLTELHKQYPAQIRVETTEVSQSC